MNFLHKSKVDPLTKTHFFCLVHVIPISHLSYPPGPLVVFWETPSRNFLFFWPGLISWLHRFLKSVVSFRARPSRVISMFSSGVKHASNQKKRHHVKKPTVWDEQLCFWAKDDSYTLKGPRMHFVFGFGNSVPIRHIAEGWSNVSYWNWVSWTQDKVHLWDI